MTFREFFSLLLEKQEKFGRDFSRTIGLLFHVEQSNAECRGIQLQKRDCFAALAMTPSGLFKNASTLVKKKGRY